MRLSRKPLCAWQARRDSSLRSNGQIAVKQRPVASFTSAHIRPSSVAKARSNRISFQFQAVFQQGLERFPRRCPAASSSSVPAARGGYVPRGASSAMASIRRWGRRRRIFDIDLRQRIGFRGPFIRRTRSAFPTRVKMRMAPPLCPARDARYATAHHRRKIDRGAT